MIFELVRFSVTMACNFCCGENLQSVFFKYFSVKFLSNKLEPIKPENELGTSVSGSIFEKWHVQNLERTYVQLRLLILKQVEKNHFPEEFIHKSTKDFP